MGTLRVWLCTEDFPPRLGGISRWSLNTTSALAGHDMDVTVLVKKRGSPVDGVRVVPVYGHDFVRRRRFHFARAARRLLRDAEAPDRMIASTWHVAEGLIDLGIPVSVAAHGMEIFRKPKDIIAGGGRLQALFRRLETRRQRVLECCDRVVCASAYTAGAVREIAPGARVTCGLNGVDLMLFSSSGEARGKEHVLQLVSVGRLVRRKNFHAVLDLVERLVAGGVDAGLWICGSGPEKLPLQERARSIPGRITFFENLPDRELAILYRSADLFVSPCLSDPVSGDVEGFGLTFVEASACGLPVAGVAEGGVSDAVEHGVSGILTTRDAFIREVSDLALNPILLRELGEKGKRRAEAEFDIGKVALNLV